MKVLLCVGTVVVLLHLVCPGSVKRERAHLRDSKWMLVYLSKLTKSANTTLPGHLLNTSVPVMDYCKKNTFCEVQQVLAGLAGLPDHEKLEGVSRSLVAYNVHAHKKCTNHKLQDRNVTIQLQDLFVMFEECIQKEIIHL